MDWLRERGRRVGGWEMGNPGNPESSSAWRRRSWEGTEGLSRLLREAVLALCVRVCVCDQLWDSSWK